ncbi:MAG: aminoacyl-tRNA hydrolase [Lachnospiraceae bacterium]|nr:aminoacyl-tRNA hydrolase [Lachnospiraceae bacterium]
MFIIAGLGNPDSEYEGTRHNTGFEVLDILARRQGIKVNRRRFKGKYGKGKIGNTDVLLLKPQTYMNLSGESIAAACSYYKCDVSRELIVIYDDVDLDPGRIRIRKSGSAGGHNGMKNIIEHLHTQEFVRVRVGVGKKPEGYDLVNWVLGHFKGDDIPLMEDARMKAADSIPDIISEGADRAMNRYNS